MSLRGDGGDVDDGVVVVDVQVVEFFFLVVVLVEADPETDPGEETRARQPGEQPHQLGVLRHRRQRDTDGGTDGVGDQEQRHDERLHSHGGLSVSVFQPSDRGEDFREGHEGVCGGLDGDVDVVGLVFVARAATGVIITGASLVDEVLQDGGVDHRTGGPHEPPEDLSDRLQRGESPHEGVHDPFTDGDEDDDGNRVPHLHDIVGDGVGVHLPRHRHEVVGHLPVHQPVDGVVDEHLTRVHGTLKLVDQVVVPRVVLFRVGRRLGGVQVELVLDGDEGNSERLLDNSVGDGDVGVDVLTQDQRGDTNEEEAEGQQVGGPEADIVFQESGGDHRQRPDVDHHVEDHEHVLHGDVGVDDDSLALLGGVDSRLGSGDLVGNQRRHVRLDTPGTQPDDDKGGGVTTESSVSRGDRGDRGDEQNQDPDDVDDGGTHNRPVLTEKGVGQVAPQDGSDVTPELEKVRQRGRPLLVKFQHPLGLVVGPVLHVVLERGRQPIVGKPLGKLDDGHEPTRKGDLFRDVSQRLHFLRGRGEVVGVLFFVGGGPHFQGIGGVDLR